MSTTEARSQRSPAGDTTRRRIIAVVAGAVAVVLVGWAGWGLHAATHGSDKVSIGRSFTGRVTLVNIDHNAGCVRPDSGGKPVCSAFAVVEGADVSVGSRVHAIYQTVNTGGGFNFGLLLVYARDR